MSSIIIPEGYQSLLGLYDTQKAIGLIKTIFQEKICMALHLKRVTAPLFVMQGSGLNDDLNGVERPVEFDVPSLNEHAEIVHSLAKWKRYALYKYGFRPGQGIVTDMNAVRRDEELDNLHSIYVDQWDWERVITADQRTLEFLQETVRDIVDAVCATSDELRWKFPELKNNIHLDRKVTFVTTQELEDIYPDFTPKQRENAYAKEHGTSYDQLNLIVCHMGGGVSVGAHVHGKVVDVENALDGDGPFSPERAGSLPTGDLVSLCFSGEYTEPQIRRMLAGGGGMVAYAGTSDMREVEKMAQEGNAKMAELIDAFHYQVGKEIGATAAAMHGKVDQIILTGGIAYGKKTVDAITDLVGWIAPITVYPGEDELLALAQGALRVLNGEEQVMKY